MAEAADKVNMANDQLEEKLESSGSSNKCLIIGLIVVIAAIIALICLGF